MSPIKPALSALRPAGPHPSVKRKIYCPHCGHGFEASRKAMSLTCPRCTSPLTFKDITIDRPVEGNVDTLGHIQISSASGMSGELACGHLTNSGKFDGSMIVHGPIELKDHSQTTGDLQGKSLQVDPGATVEGRARIGGKQNHAKPGDAPPLAAPLSRPKIRVRRKS